MKRWLLVVVGGVIGLSLGLKAQTSFTGLGPYFELSRRALALSPNTAATPALVSTADSTSGIYFPASGQVALSASGAAVLTASPTTLTIPSGVTLASGSGGWTFASGTLTTSNPFAVTQTWNAGGVSFVGLNFVFTETASAAASNYVQILGGASGTTTEFSVQKTGLIFGNSLGIGTAPATTASVSIASGAITSSANVLSATQTWNAGGVSFVGANLAFTETASAAGSNYLQILGGAAGTTTEFAVGKGGNLTALGAATLQATTNQLVLGVTNTTTLTAPAPAASRTYTIPDAGAAANVGLFANTPASLQTTPLNVYSTGSYTNATTTFSNVTGLSFSVAASTNYRAICRITWQGSAATSGPKYQFTGPAAPTAVAIGMNSVVTATTVIEASATAFSSAVANTGTITTATNFTDTVDLGLVNGTTAGTVQLQAAANGAGTLTIANGSYCAVQ